MLVGYTGVDCETNTYLLIFSFDLYDSLIYSHLLFYFLSDIDDCIPNPCANGGTCNHQINSYTCTCADTYTGKNCNTRGTYLLNFTFGFYDYSLYFNILL